MSHLNIVTVNNRLQRIFHVKIIEPEDIPKWLTDCTSRGTGSTGRLKLRWKDRPVLQGNGTYREVQTLMLLMMMMVTFIYEISN
jgi:hypothetical protein